MQKKTESRVRGNNFSKEEELHLVKIISRYKQVIENKNSDQIRPSDKEEAWQKVLKDFNSCNNHRTLGQIKSKYDNLKTAARKYMGNITRNLYSTGGGPSQPLDAKNVIYDEVLSIVNKKTVNGLSNTYDDDSILVEEVPFEEVPFEGTSTNDETNEIIEIVLDQGESFNQEDNIPRQSVDESESSNKYSWNSYTPKMLKEPKNKKLVIKNKPSPYQAKSKICLALKEQYIEQKIQNLKNEEKRKQERHEKEMELLDIEIEKKKETWNRMYSGC